MAKIAQRIYEHYYFGRTEDRQFKDAKVQEIEVWLKESYADIDWAGFPQAMAEIMLEWSKGRMAELDKDGRMIMPEYKVKKEDDENWAVVDKNDSLVYDIIYYERLTEFEALTIAEILNSGCAVNWDAVSADWRWQVALQISGLSTRSYD